MRNALQAYATPVMSFDKGKIKQCAHTAWRPFSLLTTHHPRRLLSFEEACEGAASLPFISSLSRGKSPGYPYNVDGIATKRHFFGEEPAYDFSRPQALELRADVERTIELAKEGIQRDFIYTDFLKDELRSSAKVIAGMTRLISASPIGYTIAWRMYFGAWMSAVQDTRINNGCAVGMNTYREWPHLASKLGIHGRHTFAGDFKGWDGCMQPDWHDALRDFINDWYDDGEENRRIRDILWREVSFSKHIGGLDLVHDTIYQWLKSLPSGHPATSLINCFMNLLLWVLVWYDILGPSNYHRFWDHVFVCVYGDDNILNVSPSVIDLFNMRTVTKAFLAYGMTYTDEAKLSGDVPDSRTLSECTFLKRAFLWDDSAAEGRGALLCPLSLETVAYMPYWSHTKRNIDKITTDILETTLSELSLHPKAVWDHWAPSMLQHAAAELNYVPKLPDRLTYQNFTLALESYTT
jgi:hypothetical protein